MGRATRVELRFGPVAYLKPKGARRPQTLDDLEVATGEPVSPEWRDRMREAGLTRDVDGVDVIRWPDEMSEEEA